MAKQAELISGAMLSYALAEVGTPDVEPSTYTNLENTITTIPELFSKPDTVDTTTIDNASQTSIPALPGGDSLDFGVLLGAALYTLHATIVTADTTIGGTWYKLTFDAPLSRVISFRAISAANIIINGGGGADLNEGVLALYPSSDLTEA